jgi:hypothetical protein
MNNVPYKKLIIYSASAVVTVVLLEHLGTILNVWWIRPSVPLNWADRWARYLWEQCGRGLAWAYVYFDRYLVELIRFLKLAKLWESVTNVFSPLIGILASPAQFFVGLYHVSIEYSKQHVVPIGVALSLGGLALLYRYRPFPLGWLAAVPLVGLPLSWLAPRRAAPPPATPARSKSPRRG